MPRRRKAAAGDNVDQMESSSKSKIAKLTPGVLGSEKGRYDDLASHLNSEWQNFLKRTLETENFKNIISFLNSQTAQVFPPKELIFHAFNLTHPEKVRVVILGQDPYHDDGQAHGLAFSVPRSVEKVPPSLKTLYKELREDPKVDFSDPTHGCLEHWAEQGVLLLNVYLTVEAHKPKSHRKIGWSNFTDDVIRLLCEKHSAMDKKLVFVLWGNDAQRKEKVITGCEGSHVILKGAHPSTMTCGKFYGCRHFSKVNEELNEPIDWQL